MPDVHRLFRCLQLAIAVSIAASASAQTVAFEVASVKPSPPPPGNPFGFPTRSVVRIDRRGQFSGSQLTLRELIRRAYDLPDFQIEGGPAWLTSERFEVAAKPPQTAAVPVSAETMRSMLQSLLSNRFHVKAHTESREMAVFRLIAAGRDGKPSDQLRPSKVDCPSIRASRGAETPPDDGSKPECGISYRMNMPTRTMTMELNGESLSELMRALVTETRRPVIDDTGLRGTFDGTLTFVPEPLPGFPPAPGSAPEGVSVFTALQELFGLKLEPGRGSVSVLVIESADRPTEN